MRKRARLGTPRGVVFCLLATTSCDCGGDDARDDVDAGGSDARVVDAARDAKADARPIAAECTPGAASCAGGQATFCRNDGTLARYECDSVQGLTCMPQGCVGSCDLSGIEDSYIGCDYYPTVTLNPVWSGFSFAVAVANASGQPTHVTITRGADVVQEADVAAGALQTFNLPWVAALKGGEPMAGVAPACTTPPPAGDTRIVADGAYRVRTDRPVTVYQFSPLEYELANAPLCPTIRTQCVGSMVDQCYAYSNDASLLLPATALTGNYTALSWPSQSAGSGFIAITAVEDGTQVQVSGAGFASGAGIQANGGKVSLDRGDVLELVAAANADVSGTRVRASKPVQVISGHSCAFVPTPDTVECDHLEEVAFPEDTLGNEYVVTRPFYADGTTATPSVIRVAAIADDTHVSFEPKLRDDLTLSAGGFVELPLATASDVVISADQPLLVTQYMVGNQALGQANPVGDPSLSVAVPVEQYRSEYLFTAPLTYIVNLATIVAKRGANVRVDGVAIPASSFVAIGNSEYTTATVSLEDDDADPNSAVHQVTANEEVGLTVYGYGLYTSFMYPGGADLQRITFPLPI